MIEIVEYEHLEERLSDYGDCFWGPPGEEHYSSNRHWGDGWMNKIYCRNTRDWSVVQHTLNIMPGAGGARVLMKGSKPLLTEAGLVTILGNDFVESTLKQQGYADVVRSEQVGRS